MHAVSELANVQQGLSNIEPVAVVRGREAMKTTGVDQLRLFGATPVFGFPGTCAGFQLPQSSLLFA